MLYSMKVLIENPRTSKKTERVFECKFVKDKEGYGNKYYLSIECLDHPEEYFPNLDLRYDRSFNSDRKEIYLATWAYEYWSGEKGAWKIKELTIKDMN